MKSQKLLSITLIYVGPQLVYGTQVTRIIRILSFVMSLLSLTLLMDGRVRNRISAAWIPPQERFLIPSFTFRLRRRRCKLLDRKLETLLTFQEMFILTRITRSRQSLNHSANCGTRCRRELTWTRKILLTLSLRTPSRLITICTCTP